MLSADGHKANIAGSAGRVGFLDVTFGDGTANSKIDLDADVNVKFTNSEVNADGKITLSELQGTELSSLVTQNATGSLGVSLPTSATLGSFTFGNALLTLTDTNLFDAVAPALTLGGAGSADMLKFNNINSSQMLTLADELGNFLNGLQALDVLSFDVPFVKGENLGVLDDFGSLFASKLTSGAAVDGLRELVKPAGADGTGEVLPNTPSFHSAQELGKTIAKALDLADTNAGVVYDPSTGELSYHITLATSLTESAKLTLDVPDAGALHGVTSAAVPTLSEKGTLDLTFGIKLIPVAPDPTPLVDTNPADDNQVPDPTPLHDPDLSDNDSLERHFFVKDAKLTGEVTLSASAITGSGLFGLVDLSFAQGTASGKATFTRDLIDPATTASRVTLESLLVGVSANPAALTTAAALSGTPTLDLTVVSAGPSGIVPALSGNPTITLQPSIQPATASSKTDARFVFSPASFTASTDFNDALLKFANLDAGDIVAALQEADDYLGQIATLGRLGEPIPALGVSAAGLANIAGALDATIASLDANPPSSLAEVASHIRAALVADGKTAVTVTFAADSADTLGQTLKLSLQFGSSTGSKMPLRLDLKSLAEIADQGSHNDVNDQVCAGGPDRAGDGCRCGGQLQARPRHQPRGSGCPGAVHLRHVERDADGSCRRGWPRARDGGRAAASYSRRRQRADRQGRPRCDQRSGHLRRRREGSGGHAERAHHDRRAGAGRYGRRHRGRRHRPGSRDAANDLRQSEPERHPGRRHQQPRQ